MLSIVLQFTSTDYKFLKANLDQCSKFSNDIIVTVCDRFFSGEPEDKLILLEMFKIISSYKNAKLHFFPWEGPMDNPNYYHNYSRKLGTFIAKNRWILFLDADEILDDDFGSFFEKIKYDTSKSYCLTCYWYFKQPVFRAKALEGCGLLITKEKLNWNLETNAERQQFFGIENFVFCVNEQDEFLSRPLVHHFSWVRTKQQMLTKVKNWGHKGDRDWVSLVEEEFSHPFTGRDFVHNYEYDVVEDKFNLGYFS